jgi:hypothetical protein
MGKVRWSKAGRDDPMFKEGWRSYSPHWAMPFQKPASDAADPPRNGCRQARRPYSGSPAESRRSDGLARPPLTVPD